MKYIFIFLLIGFCFADEFVCIVENDRVKDIMVNTLKNRDTLKSIKTKLQTVAVINIDTKLLTDNAKRNFIKADGTVDQVALDAKLAQDALDSKNIKKLDDKRIRATNRIIFKYVAECRAALGLPNKTEEELITEISEAIASLD